jgi:hypothetical protein
MSNTTDKQDFMRLEALKLAVHSASSSTGILENADKYYEWLIKAPEPKKSTRKTSVK